MIKQCNSFEREIIYFRSKTLNHGYQKSIEIHLSSSNLTRLKTFPQFVNPQLFRLIKSIIREANLQNKQIKVLKALLLIKQRKYIQLFEMIFKIEELGQDIALCVKFNDNIFEQSSGIFMLDKVSENKLRMNLSIQYIQFLIQPQQILQFQLKLKLTSKYNYIKHKKFDLKNANKDKVELSSNFSLL
ncbi:unnamed protein product [Paramecium octaurelia]|uniref:Uncharacterized protein n=1 Tax=Paramecium octaurelia TaxID=43137 RepID=A0A8S1YE81_PAROT|nr:unnamed protein product [Paramecium octaurelia]